MAKSQQTFSKYEREKKQAKKREEKQKRKDLRKANSNKGAGFDNMIVYVDENGNFTDTPPDPAKKIKIDAASIEIGIPKKENRGEEESSIKEGKVSFFDSSKGFGFIIEKESREKYFVHVSETVEEIKENDKVSFELERGLKGINAVNVKKI